MLGANAMQQRCVELQQRLLMQHDEVESHRHTGESRYPASESKHQLDPGFRRGDEFKDQWAASIGEGTETDADIAGFIAELGALLQRLCEAVERRGPAP